MSTTITAQFLLEGAVYGLEQCGFLLRDSNLQYRNGSYASAVALAALAREELGRWTILLGLRRKVLAGHHLTITQVQKACENHVRKQIAGMKSISLRGDRNSGVGKVLHTRMMATPGRAEWKAAQEQIDQIDQQKKKREPNERHKMRMSAVYVDPASDGKWNKPAEAIFAMDAYEFIADAVNDYSVQSDQWYMNLEFVKLQDPELHDALQRWTDRPQLPPPDMAQKGEVSLLLATSFRERRVLNTRLILCMPSQH
jgi:AbiV family abortive infection protein